jgi:hypothetical protein
MQRGISLVISEVDPALSLVEEKGLDTLFMAVGAGQVERSVAMVISRIDTTTITKKKQLWS